jgi:NDP-sugar pyrophosphorylase family protein/aminoglycoside/choline kinase family phosphotransferase
MNGVPEKALVLAAGLGKRLRPLTLARPKPLLPLWGVPLLGRVLDMLEAWGVKEVAVNLHWKPELIQEYLAGCASGLGVRFSHEPEILGTGGALRPLRSFFEDGSFWVVNSDIAAALDPVPLLSSFRSGGGLAAAWLEPKKGPRTVEADRKGRITCFRSPTPGVPGTYTFCGVQLVTPRIFEFLPDKKVFSIIEVYERAMEQGIFVDGVVLPGSYWDDAGTPEAYLRVHKETAAAGLFQESFVISNRGGKQARSRKFAFVADSAKVAPDAVIEDSVILNGTRIMSGSVLNNCIATGGTLSGRLKGVICMAATECGVPEVAEAVAAMGWKPQSTAAVALGERGSDRAFWRVYDGASSAIVIKYSNQRPENRLYAGHARFLAEAGVPVPEVLADLPQRGCMALEDCGDDSLAGRMRARPSQASRWYVPAIRALAQMHGEGTRRAVKSGLELEAPFDAKLYAWEHGLFEEQILKRRFGYDSMPADVRRELGKAAGRLDRAVQVLVHRDFQSSNILFKGRRLFLIDFQGMRMGAAAYDLASLLYDPYVKLTNELREWLVEEYAKCLPATEADSLVHTGAVQRLVQALGAFGRLDSVGQSGFTRFIMPALENLLDAADQGGYDAVGALAEDLIAREKKRFGWW